MQKLTCRQKHLIRHALLEMEYHHHKCSVKIRKEMEKICKILELKVSPPIPKIEKKNGLK